VLRVGVKEAGREGKGDEKDEVTGGQVHSGSYTTNGGETLQNKAGARCRRAGDGARLVTRHIFAAGPL
jgi:hypothetical protein